MDDARQSFMSVIEKHPKDKLAVLAANRIMESHRLAKEWQKMADWSDALQNMDLGTPELKQGLLKEAKVLKVGALFKKAEGFFADGKYEEAATEYESLVNDNPDNEFSDRALNNAAVAYEKLKKFESATRVYERIVNEYPKSEFTENALYRVAINAERFYLFEKASDAYESLTQRFKQSEYRIDAHRESVLLNERLQNYDKAARLAQGYARLFPNEKDAAEMFYRSAYHYERQNQPRKQLKVYQRFIKTYGRDPKHNRYVIESLSKTSEIYATLGNERAKRKTEQRIIDEFSRRGMEPGSFEAQYPAKALFGFIESEFQGYQALKLEGSLENQGRVIRDMQKRIQNLNRRYAEVITYQSFEWTLATFYRLGQLYQIFAERLYEAPIPESFSMEEEDMYRTQLEDLALPIEDKAVESYETAYSKAKEFKVNTEWTRRIRKVLNKYKPSEYPLFKTEIPLSRPQRFTPYRMALPVYEAPIDHTEKVEDSATDASAMESTDTAPADTAPADTAPTDTTPVDASAMETTAPADAAPTDASPDKADESEKAEDSSDSAKTEVTAEAWRANEAVNEDINRAADSDSISEEPLQEEGEP